MNLKMGESKMKPRFLNSMFYCKISCDMFFIIHFSYFLCCSELLLEFLSSDQLYGELRECSVWSCSTFSKLYVFVRRNNPTLKYGC